MSGGATPSKLISVALQSLREALAAYGVAKKIKPSSSKRYDSLVRTHFVERVVGPIDDPGGQAFSGHCHAFAQSKGDALVDVGQGVVPP
jgi:hypothetical protein